MAQSHTGHLTGSDAVTTAVFRQFGVTRVDGLDELLEVSAALARTRPDEAAGVGEAARRARACASTRSPAAPARTWPTCSPTPGLRLPDLTKETQTALHDGLIPAYLRVSNPVDCGGPPVADARGRKILDAILADKNVDIVVVPITGAVAIVQRAAHPRPHRRRRRPPTSRSSSIWGAPSGTDDTYYKRLLDGGLPMFRTFGNCVAAVQGVRRLLDVRGALPLAVRRRADRRRSPAAKKARALLDEPGAGRGALGVASRSSCSQAYGIKTSQRRAVHVGRRRR